MHRLIAWFARNSVAANLLMVFIIAWGLGALFTRIPLEVFPGFAFDQVVVSAAYPGASPVDVEQAVTIPLELAIEDIEGIETISSTASEGIGTLTAEISDGYDATDIRNLIEQQIATISSFPAAVDRPSVRVPQVDREVISVVVAGELPESELRAVASRVRDELSALPRVSSVSLSGTRNLELAIEVLPSMLDRYGLTLSDVVNAIESASVDLAAGAITTATGELLLRAQGQAQSPEEFGDIVVLNHADNTYLTLRDIATIRDGFDQEQVIQTFNGQRSIEINVYRTGLQSAIAVADDVKQYLLEAQNTMPYGVTLGYWRDWSRALKARVDTLTKSAVQGGVLVVILLSLFLRFWVAVWVMFGVPVSMLGGIALMPHLGVSLNLLSLFAFILVLGIVVDDAIVTGENIYTHMRRQRDRVQAVIDGTKEVALPVTFGVLTTVAAFSPLLMIDGARGKVFAQIPLVVIPVLLFSIVESKLILPAHMSHLNFFKDSSPGLLARWQRRIAEGFEHFVQRRYQPLLAAALRQRYLVLSLFAGVALVLFSMVSSGHIRFVFFPRVQAETAYASLEMPFGTPFDITAGHIVHMQQQASVLQARYIDPETGDSVIESIMTNTGQDAVNGSHLGRVMFEIVPPDERRLKVSSQQLVDEWRELIGDITGAKSVSYRAEIGRGGSPLDVEISGLDLEVMQVVSDEIKDQLSRYSGLSEISDSFDGGSEQLLIHLKPVAESMGFSLGEVARQVRAAYQGTEVQSLQRGRDEVSVVVRLPPERRTTISQLQQLSISSGSGSRVPLATIAQLEIDGGFARISRFNQRRILNVRAEADKQSVNMEGIKAELQGLIDWLENEHEDVRISLEGEAREQRESFASLRSGLVLVLLIIYALLAIPFRSYIQPLLVMVVIPFGIVGGILGHLLMGMSLSIMSYMGMLALCGVVVNDSLVLVDWINRQRRQGMLLVDAVRNAGVARFRAVILTSMTTFFGLLPLIFETSTQAQFLIPMAVSLGYGIVFATLITLILVPVNYLVLEDIKALFNRGGSL